MGMSEAMLSSIAMKSSYHWWPSMRSMVRWIENEDRTFEHNEPQLCPREKRIIPLFQDESSFHASKYKLNIWWVFCAWALHRGVWLWLHILDRLHTREQKLMKKGRGWIIHVSDFIEKENSWLIIKDQDGTIRKDVWCITYPGANSDSWWDLAQLLKQVNNVILIFEEAHPGCHALFLFNQSSAHTSLGPEALCAFNMNKSNDGKQQKWKDTIILMSNPDPHYWGLPQKMTLETGEPKGLQQTPEECGFNVTGLRAKCSPICPMQNECCCMACLLSKQEDFQNQTSLFEQTITDQGHLCVFLPKFHCKLNPIKMVCDAFISHVQLILIPTHTVLGVMQGKIQGNL